MVAQKQILLSIHTKVKRIAFAGLLLVAGSGRYPLFQYGAFHAAGKFSFYFPKTLSTDQVIPDVQHILKFKIKKFIS